jgi:Kef-type K+ transport system membrane component KefB
VISYLPAIFALVVAAAGWFYMFYSRAAAKLHGIEPSATNRMRVRLRQVGGLSMMLLAIAFYAGYVAIDQRRVEQASFYMFAVLALLAIIIVLGLADLRLTNKLRKSDRDQDEHEIP